MESEDSGHTAGAFDAYCAGYTESGGLLNEN